MQEGSEPATVPRSPSLHLLAPFKRHQSEQVPAEGMVPVISLLCLLLTAGALFAVDPKQSWYRREDGKFRNTSELSLRVPSRMTCAFKCTTTKPWFCGGFTYHDSGTCELFRDTESATCAGTALEVDTGSELRSYSRLHSPCPGMLSGSF